MFHTIRTVKPVNSENCITLPHKEVSQINIPCDSIVGKIFGDVFFAKVILAFAIVLIISLLYQYGAAVGFDMKKKYCSKF